MMRFVLTLAVLFAALAPAAAQHKHGSKGPNGGPMEDVAGVHAELLTSGTTVTINVLDEDSKPIKAAGYSGSALIVSGSQRETIKLEPAGEASLKGEAKNALAANTQVTLMLKTAAGKSGQARFKIEK
jgi:hypothetical protein